MRKFEFVFEVEGFDLENDHQIQALYDAFGDVTASSNSGRVTLTFLQEANGASDALHNTWDKLRETLSGVQVMRLDRDLVSVTDIADRTNRTPESVRLLTFGRRGSGNFPSPVATLSGGIRVWEWSSVVAWFQGNGELSDEPHQVDRESAALFDAALVTDARRRTPQVLLRKHVHLQSAGATWIMEIKSSSLGSLSWRPDVSVAETWDEAGEFV